MQKVAVIGLDCAAPRLVFDAWREDMPNLRSLMERGLWGEMRSSDPPITVPAWASMLASKDPGQLGLYGFRNRRAHTYEDYSFASSRMIKHDMVWDIVSRAGQQVILLGIPATYPPRRVNGCMVTCFLTPSNESEYTYPAELKAEVEQVAEGYVFDVGDFRSAARENLLWRIREKTRKHFRVAKHLLATKPWDFFMMVEMGMDRAHHAFWRHCDPQHPKHERGSLFGEQLRQYYTYVDREIGEVLDLVGPEAAVFVVSDHGARALEGGVRVNDWLIEQGLLTLRERPRRPVPLSAALVDWSKTRVWGEGGYCGRLFVNVRGREPEGTIDPGDYERVRDDLIAAVAALQEPGGGPMGSHAHRPQDLYVATSAVPPDLLVYFGDLSWRSLSSVGGDGIYAFENDTGADDANHDWNGIFIMRDGRRDLRGRRLGALQLMDVAPTILGHLGIPIPEDMLGTPIDAGRAVDADGSPLHRPEDAWA